MSGMIKDTLRIDVEHGMIEKDERGGDRLRDEFGYDSVAYNANLEMWHYSFRPCTSSDDGTQLSLPGYDSWHENTHSHIAFGCVQYGAVQYNAVQYSTVQYSTILYAREEGRSGVRLPTPRVTARAGTVHRKGYDPVRVAWLHTSGV
eukprot:IDg15086t1